MRRSRPVYHDQFGPWTNYGDAHCIFPPSSPIQSIRRDTNSFGLSDAPRSRLNKPPRKINLAFTKANLPPGKTRGMGCRFRRARLPSLSVAECAGRMSFVLGAIMRRAPYRGKPQ